MEIHAQTGKILNFEAFCQRMQELLGEEAEDFFSSYGKEREYGLRYNPLKFISREEFEEKQEKELGCRLSPVPWCAEGYYYQSQDRPGRHPWHEIAGRKARAENLRLVRGAWGQDVSDCREDAGARAACV